MILQKSYYYQCKKSMESMILFIRFLKRVVQKNSIYLKSKYLYNVI